MSKVKLTTAALAIAACALAPMAGAQEEPLVLMPFREATVASALDSEMLEYCYKIGEPFTNGALIARLEDSRFQVMYKRAREQLDYTTEIAKEQRELRSKDFASEMDLRRARHDMKLAEAEFAEAQLNLERCRFVAPFNGRLAEIFTQCYEMSKPGQPLFRVIEDDRLLAVANLPLGKLKVGMKVTIRPDGADKVSGKVYEISPQADNRTGTVRVRILVDNSKGLLTAGMTGVLEDTPEPEEVVESEAEAKIEDVRTWDFQFPGPAYESEQAAFSRQTKYAMHLTNDWRAVVVTSNYPAYWQNREIVVNRQSKDSASVFAVPPLAIVGLHFDDGLLAYVLHRYPRVISLSSVKRVGELTAGLYDAQGKRVAQIAPCQVELPTDGHETTNTVHFVWSEYAAASERGGTCRLVVRVDDDIRAIDVKIGKDANAGK